MLVGEVLKVACSHRALEGAERLLASGFGLGWRVLLAVAGGCWGRGDEVKRGLPA